MPVNPPTTLQNIRNKVRLLTRSPVELLPTVDLDNYINTFMVYDMPDHIQMFDLKTTFSFWCEPFIDVYYTDTTHNAPTDALYDWQNKYTSIDGPLYIAGYESYLSQSREQFYQQYPIIQSIQTIATGDGVTQNFSGTLTGIPVLRNQVTFASVATNNTGLTLTDNGSGILYDPQDGLSTGTINYVTGAFTLAFSAAPANGVAISSQTVPYVPSRPVTMLFYDNKFTLRPVPNQPYMVTFDAYLRPIALLAGQNPMLQDWWQYIAYGAAKKVFEDRMQPDFVAIIMPEFKKQEVLVMRKTIVNQAKERSATIYSEQTNIGANPFGWNRLY